MRQRAKIVRAVDVIYGTPDDIAALPVSEPIMEMADGRQVPAYQCDRFTREGVEGWAELDSSRNIWTFTPDSGEIGDDDLA
jgi:hypothetical protein